MADYWSRISSLSTEQRRLLAERLRRERFPDDASARSGTVEAPPTRSAVAPSGRPMAFSLFFFSAEGFTTQPDKYRLLLESAEYADRHGLAAVWTPERHFQGFGGLYPNPSLLGAALAMVTSRIQIRAGSVALPLHHPVRVAEEWAVVDNLSGGRVGISFGSGWHPQDFVLARERYANRKEFTHRHIQTIRDLWAGKKVRFSDPDGVEYELGALPRPLQAEIPIWISIAGNPQSWISAGQVGANVLTMFVSESPEGLSRKISLYHEALRSNGFRPQDRTVTVMLHTFLGADDDLVKDRVRGPLTQYLRSFLEQKEELPGGPRDGVGDYDKDAMVRLAFERYVRDKALLGTPEKCFRLVEQLLDVGVTEIACLIDFGLDPETVLAGLEHIVRLQACYDGGGLRPASAARST
jgi:natural product biosynthesis luciferase-like monooxygenase protein